MRSSYEGEQVSEQRKNRERVYEISDAVFIIRIIIPP